MEAVMRRRLNGLIVFRPVSSLDYGRETRIDSRRFPPAYSSNKLFPIIVRSEKLNDCGVRNAS